MFQIVMVAMFPAHKIRESIEGCIAEVRLVDPGASETELDELKGYMAEFLRDVDQRS
jgi:hypothetical protein